MDNQLIKVSVSEKGNQVVSARELHEFLEVKTRFNDWIKSQFDRAMLVENQDYICLTEKKVTQRNDGQEGVSVQTDYVLKMSSAKEIAMLNGGEKGKQARTYFIECEKQLMEQSVIKVPTQIEVAKLYLASLEENEVLKEKALLDKPKVDFFDKIIEAEGTFDLQEVSALMKLSYGRNTLFKRLRESKVLIKDNLPYREFIDAGYFIVNESSFETKGRTVITYQTRVTQKGLDWLLKNKVKFCL